LDRELEVHRSIVEAIAVRIAGEIVLSEHPWKTLRRWRETFQASQVQVARKMGVSPSVVSDYEKGRRTPGVQFVRRYVEALLEIDSERGWPTVKKLAKSYGLKHLRAVLDMGELEEGVDFDELVKAVKGIPLTSVAPPEKVYGYTVVDSISAILSLSGNEFLYIMGATSRRALVFTHVTTGRSPMIAVRVAPIKPAVVVVHGPKRVDFLAIMLAEAEHIPLILSTAKTVEELLEGLRKLARV